MSFFMFIRFYFLHFKFNLLSNIIYHFNKLLIKIFLFFTNNAKSQLTVNFSANLSANSSDITNYLGSSILFFLQNQTITNTTPTMSVLKAHNGDTITTSTIRTPFGVTF